MRSTLAVVLSSVLAGCVAWTPQDFIQRGERADIQLRGDYRSAADCVLARIDGRSGYTATRVWNDAEGTVDVQARMFNETVMVVRLLEGARGTVGRVYARGDAQSLRSWFAACT